MNPSQNPRNTGIDTQRLAQLLDRYLELEKAGASHLDHKDHDDLEATLDHMQLMMGMGMVMARDVVAKAKKTLGRP